MSELTQNALVAQLEALLVAARKDVADDDERWARLACGQDTEEAEESGRLVGHAEGLAAALELVKQQPTATVHVVEVFDRTDGTYVFADHDDAVAFQATIDGDAELSVGSRCLRTEQVVCSHADALKLIAAECEASEDAIAASLESNVPVASHAWAKDEDAPENLECVEYTVYPADSEEGDGAKAVKRHLWVGLHPEVGCVNVDAGRERLEGEGWQVSDWGAA